MSQRPKRGSCPRGEYRPSRISRPYIYAYIYRYRYRYIYRYIYKYIFSALVWESVVHRSNVLKEGAMYIHIYIHVCMYVCIYIYIYIFIYVCYVSLYLSISALVWEGKAGRSDVLEERRESVAHPRLFGLPLHRLLQQRLQPVLRKEQSGRHVCLKLSQKLPAQGNRRIYIYVCT